MDQAQMTNKKPKRNEDEAQSKAAAISPLRRAAEDFDAAIAKHDYEAAISAAYSSDASILADNDPMSRDILAKILPTKADAAAYLRHKVSWGEPVPPVLALYVADLLVGQNLGRPRKSPKEAIGDDIALITLIGELAEPALSAGASRTAALETACKRADELFRQVRSGSMHSDIASNEALSRLASKTIGHANWESIQRAYHRAAQNRSKKGQEKS